MASAPPENGFTEPYTTDLNTSDDNKVANGIQENGQGFDHSHETRCDCFKKISKHIVSIDKVDDLCEEEDAACLYAVGFLEKVPVKTRSAVAKYLSSGKASHLNLSKDNVHHIFHIADLLHLQQLSKICIDFCSSETEQDIISVFEECPLREEVIRRSQLFQRSLSYSADSAENSPQEFYVVFSRNVTETKKGGKETTNVIVINISEKLDVYKRETRQLGKATDCCSSYIDDSPHIFVCGGEDKSAEMMWKYDVLLGSWSKCAKMIHGRSRHNMVADENGSVYAIGGMEVGCIEKYDIRTNKWKEIGALKTRVYNAVATLYKGSIYIFGGRTTSGYVATTQCYKISTNSVKKLEDLPCEVSRGEAVVHNDKIFIATQRGHTICYEPEEGLSYLCAQQPIERDYFGMFVKDERLYVVGGVLRKQEDDTSADTPMYRYNPVKDEWKEENKLHKSFPVYSACIVKYPRKCPVIPFKSKH